MTTARRYRIWAMLQREAEEYMMSLSPEERKERLAYHAREHDRSNENLIRGLLRGEERRTKRA